MKLVTRKAVAVPNIDKTAGTQTMDNLSHSAFMTVADRHLLGLTGKETFELRRVLNARISQHLRAKNEVDSPLLRLSPELLLLIGESVFELQGRRSARGEGRRATGVALLQTCSGLREQLSPLFFAKQDFDVLFTAKGCDVDLRPWLSAYPKTAYMKIGLIFVKFYDGGETDANIEGKVLTTGETFSIYDCATAAEKLERMVFGKKQRVPRVYVWSQQNALTLGPESFEFFISAKWWHDMRECNGEPILDAAWRVSLCDPLGDMTSDSGDDEGEE